MGEIWSIGLTNAAGTRTKYSYPVADVHGNGTVTLQDVANGLKNVIGAEYDVDATTIPGRLIIHRVDNGPFKVDSPAVTPIANPQGSITTAFQSFNFSGLTAVDKEVWSLQLGTATYNATLGTTTLKDGTVIKTIADLGKHFVEQGDNKSGFSVNYVTDVLTITNSTNDSFDATLTIGAGTQAVQKTMQLDLASAATPIRPGEAWSLTLGGISQNGHGGQRHADRRNDHYHPGPRRAVLCRTVQHHRRRRFFGGD